MNFIDLSPWWIIGIFWLIAILIVASHFIGSRLSRKQKMVIEDCQLYLVWYLMWLFLGLIMSMSMPLFGIVFLIFALFLHIYFARVYIRRNDKEYSFIDHLAGEGYWFGIWGFRDYKASRFETLLLWIWLFLILLGLGENQRLMIPVMLFGTNLLFLYAGYQTELKKRSHSRKKA